MRQFLAAVLLFTAAALVVPRADAAVLTHDYEFNGSLADALGGPSLVSLGGTLGATNYAFGANQGLTLANAISTSNYSVELDFQFASLTGYRKILDFKNLTSDNGFYNLNTGLNLYPTSFGPAGALTTNTLAHVVLTRDGATGQVTGYANGVQQFTFIDGSGFATFTAANNLMTFFTDDPVTANEAAAGVVERIRIYEGALTAAQVAALAAGGTPPGAPSGVPLPAAVWAGLALAGVVMGTRRIRDGVYAAR